MLVVQVTGRLALVETGQAERCADGGQEKNDADRERWSTGPIHHTAVTRLNGSEGFHHLLPIMKLQGGKCPKLYEDNNNNQR